MNVDTAAGERTSARSAPNTPLATPRAPSSDAGSPGSSPDDFASTEWGDTEWADTCVDL